MIRRGAGLLSDSAGVTALEFALVAPALVFLLVAGIEVGLSMMLDATLDLAVGQAARFGKTTERSASCAEADGDSACRMQEIRRILHARLDPWASKPSDIRISVRSYPTWSDARGASGTMPDPGSGTAGQDPGGRSSIVLYSVMVERPSFSGIFSLIDMDVLTFQRSTIIRNE